MGVKRDKEQGLHSVVQGGLPNLTPKQKEKPKRTLEARDIDAAPRAFVRPVPVVSLA